ncbi:kielin/chordin-like protein [Amphiura filiformis]|uniref:kielin/chordin-like protein n=1 Tax=Amphiura filiformis TaxID=82378 RepID=UPI003B213335
MDEMHYGKYAACEKPCTREYKPKCGTDGNTYSNQCVLSIEICKDPTLAQAHDGPCPPAPIGIECEKACRRDYRPKCGTDGVTYNNQCLFEIAVCKNPQLGLDSEGPCPPACEIGVCVLVNDPHCGTDGNTYSNLCALRQAKCSNPVLDVLYKGDCLECPIQACTFGHNPQCGSDGTTYSNPCSLDAARCNDAKLTLAYSGRCQGCPIFACNQNWDPQCGSDGTTYANPCLLRSAQCNDQEIVVAYVGECLDCPIDVCTTELEYICGTDGTTYNNQCEMNQAKCVDSSIEKAYDGECTASCWFTQGALTRAHLETWEDGPCTDCTCVNGESVCREKICGIPFCPDGVGPISVDGICCPVCPSHCQLAAQNAGPLIPGRFIPQCTETGEYHRRQCHGSTGYCWCVNEIGEELEGTRIRGELDCEPVGDYKNCTARDGSMRMHGETWAKGCTNCSCINGERMCTVVVCDWPQCPGSAEPITKPGECCPSCPETTDDCVIEDGTTKAHGERWQQDECTDCTCENGQANCGSVVCGEPQCKGGKKPKLRPGNCCPTCSNKGCAARDGTPKANKDRWSEGPCTECLCKRNKNTCNTIACDIPQCPGNARPVYSPEECCPTCPEVLMNCVDENRLTRAHGDLWQEGPCNNCTCNNGEKECLEIVCDWPQCPDGATPITKPGDCCPSCPEGPASCVADDGTTKAHGENWQDDACTYCTCQNGQSYCDSVLCGDPRCEGNQKAVLRPGDCCPSCPGTRSGGCSARDGSPKSNGESWSEGPCRDCTCTDGIRGCNDIICGWPQCPGNVLPETKPGDCCPSCPGEPTSCAAEDGTTKSSGESWSEGPCTNCFCRNGTKDCNMIQCGWPNCPGGAQPVTKPGDCCPSCPGDGRGGCNAEDGTPKSNGESWSEGPCTDCICVNGGNECIAVICDWPRCPGDAQPVTKPGDCCPGCPEELSTCVTEDGTTKAHGERWSEGPCTDCTCWNGTKDCNMIQCGWPNCPGGATPVTKPGTCCPSCPGDGRGGCNARDGTPKSNGESWSEGPCADCICVNGVNECIAVICDWPQCPGDAQPVTKPGDCCPGCPVDDDVIPPFLHANGDGVCISSDGSPKSNVDSWSEGPCRECACNDGVKECHDIICGWPICPGNAQPVTKPGDCCSSCPEEPSTCVAEDGTTKSHGERWSEGPCTDCTCMNGTNDCNTLQCGWPNCPLGATPVTKPGDCCPSCPGDDSGGCNAEDGTPKSTGESWFEGPCTDCTCTDGIKQCNEIVCDWPRCPGDAQPVTKPGDCCPSCPEELITTCAAEDGTTKSNGERWSEGPCSDCTCSEGIKECLLFPCSVQECPKGATPVTLPGECCPSCPGKGCAARDGSYRANKASWFEGPCTECLCKKHKKTCNTIACDIPQCPGNARLVYTTEECCPTCPEDLSTCVTEDGTTKSEGDKWSEGPCTDCTCMNGTKDCNMIQCGWPRCPGGATPVTKPGDCCPSCPEEPLSTCVAEDGTTKSNGERWSEGTCTDCTCSEGIKECLLVACSLQLCDGGVPSITLPGDCCPSCPGDGSGSCTARDGTPKSNGEGWSEGPCRDCTCTDGIRYCNDIICDWPRCPGDAQPVTKPGDCCPGCPEELSTCVAEDGTTKSNGERWSEGPCTDCTCWNGTKDCNMIQCGWPNCPGGATPVTKPGDCCPSCCL